MIDFEKQPLWRLLNHIEHDDYTLAFGAWSEHLQNMSKPCEHCPYATPRAERECCACLEARYRTLSLYKSGQTGIEGQLLRAARKLNRHCTNGAHDTREMVKA